MDIDNHIRLNLNIKVVFCGVKHFHVTLSCHPLNIHDSNSFRLYAPASDDTKPRE